MPCLSLDRCVRSQFWWASLQDDSTDPRVGVPGCASEKVGRARFVDVKYDVVVISRTRRSKIERVGKAGVGVLIYCEITERGVLFGPRQESFRPFLLKLRVGPLFP